MTDSLVFKEGKHTINLKCEMLIDQGLKIGEDSVGHHCMNDASWEHEDGMLVCDQCKEMIEKGQGFRITLPTPPYGRVHQEKIIKKCCDEILGARLKPQEPEL